MPTNDNEWLESAACRGLDPAIFYPVPADEEAAVAYTVETTAPAKAICAVCPVREECYYESQKPYVDKHYGVWGGLSPSERRRRRERERGAIDGPWNEEAARQL